MTDLPLEALRRLVAGRELDGYLVPRGDEHLGEDVAPGAERLRFLSGFSGSAGVAIVLPERAALFTDGRYVIQVRSECGPDWDCLHSGEHPPREWLAALERSGLRIGYDPRVIGAAALAELAGNWGELVPVADNLVDAVWTGRPPPPAGPVRVQDAALSGRTVADTLSLVAGMLAAADEDAAVLSDPASVCWLFNIRGDDLSHTPAVLAHAVVRRDGTATLLVDPARTNAAVRAHLGTAVELQPPAGIERVLDALSGRRVRVDPARSPAWFAQALEAAGAVVVAAPDPCLMFKACKTAAELRGFREAHLRDGVALCRFLFWVAEQGIGHSEHEASEQLLRLRLEHDNCSGASFASIAAAGANAAIMHYRPDATASAVLGSNQLFLIDSGGQYPAATTDVTRTVWLGPDAPPDALREQFTAVLRGLIALSEARFPDGTGGHRLDLLARLPLWQAGLDFDHGAGHGLGAGFGVHEWPYAFSSRPPGGPVHAGMVLTVEPGYYLPGSHGIRLENAMAVVEVRPGGGAAGDGAGDGAAGDGATGGGKASFCGFDTLTLAPIDRLMIDADALSPAEREWVDAYHARVRAEIAPRLDAAAAQWLERACAPLSGR